MEIDQNDPSSAWEEVKRYIDSLDPDLRDAFLSEEHTALEEFYRSLHEKMLEQLSRTNVELSDARKEREDEHSKLMRVLEENYRLKKLF